MTIEICHLYVWEHKGLTGCFESLFQDGQTCFPNIHKTLKKFHKEYCTQVWSPVYRHGNLNVILRLEGFGRKGQK